MRFVFGAAFLFTIGMGVLWTTPTFAITCTDRKGVCLAYCEKHYNRAPKCMGVCEELLHTCMSTGCWESKVTAKRCGISKQ